MVRSMFALRRPCAAVVALAGCAAVASAQDIPSGFAPCAPMSCDPVDVGPYAPPSGWRFVPDRRPVAVITLSNGNYSLNDHGLVGWWHCEGTYQDDGFPYGYAGNGIADAFDELIDRMDDLYNVGFRRIQLRLPAGNIDEEQNYADSSQWWSMPEWRRAGFQTAVAAWIAEKTAAADPVTMSVYAGYKLADPCFTGMDGSHLPKFDDPADACTNYQNVQPWIDIGVKEYWFDNSSPTWRDMKDLQHSSNFSQGNASNWLAIMKIGGEAVPTTTGSCATSPSTVKVPQPEALAAGAWVASYRFARSRFTYNNTFRSFNPNTTEVGLMLNSQPTPEASIMCGPAPHNSPAGKAWDFDDAKKFYDRGWVLWACVDSGGTQDYAVPRGASTEAVMRIYDFGPIASIADFDGDGKIYANAAGLDYLEFFDAWSSNLLTSHPMPTFAMGDVNGDNYVDFEDLAVFALAAENWLLGIVDGIDLGQPAWVP
jgi:hypothetical protein